MSARLSGRAGRYSFGSWGRVPALPPVLVLALVAAGLAVTSSVLVVLNAAPAHAAVGGDPSAEAVALAEAARSGHRVEVTAEATETETVYANPDGTLTSEVSQSPVRVPDAGGDLVPVDLDLGAASGGRIEPQASATQVSFSSTGAGELASVDTAGASSFGMSFGDGLGAPAVQGGQATYPVAGADPASVSMAVTSQGFSAHVVLPEAPVVAPTYTFPLSLDGLDASLSNNRLVLTRPDGTVAAESATLSMWDARKDAAGDPAVQVPVDAALVPAAGGGTALQLRPSMGFLTDPDTQYPVTVDPDVTVPSVTRVSDTYVSSGATGTNYSGEYRLRVGSNDGTTKYRAFEEFDIARHLGRTVTSATMSLYQYYAQTCTAKQNVFYPTDPPTVNGITWANQPAAKTSALWSATPTFNHGASGCAKDFQSVDVTKLVNGYTSGHLSSANLLAGGTDTNLAVVEIRAGDETDTSYDKRFCSLNFTAGTGTDCDTADRQPKLSLTYVPDLGDEKSYSLTDHKLNDHATLSVNNANGNAVLHAKDVNIAQQGPPITLDRFYNSQSDRTGALGPKWQLSGGPDVYLSRRTTTSDYAYDYHSPNGRVFGGFERKTSVTSSDPANDYNKFFTPMQGVGATLKDTVNATTKTFTLTFHKSQKQYTFADVDTNASDTNLYLTREEDRSGNWIAYNYVTGTHQLSTVTDQAGHTLSAGYTGGVITSLSDANASPTRTWSYHYTGGRLDKYTDPDGKAVDYGYTTDPGNSITEITTITDAANGSGQRPTATLTPTANQITAVRYSIGASTVGFDFSYYTESTNPPCQSGDDRMGSVQSSDVTKGKVWYCFRDKTGDLSGEGEIHRVVDGNGNTRSTEFGPDMQPKSFASADSGTTVNTYGGGELSDQLQKVTAPKDSATSSSSTSSTLTYETGSGHQGSDYLPSAKLDGSGVCIAYEYDQSDSTTAPAQKGRLTDAWIGTSNTCSGQELGHHYHQELNPNGTVAYSYDPNGTHTATSDAQSTVYSYWGTGDTGYVANTVGQVKSVRKPGGNCADTVAAGRKLCTSYTYDGRDRIATLTDGRGKVTTYTYDTLDRVTQVLLDGATSCAPSAGTCVQYTYDAEGNLTQRADPRGTTTFGYNQLNRQTSITTPDGTVVGYTYNDDGRLTVLATTLSGGSTHTVAYGYDAAEQPLTVHDDQLSSRTISLGHDGDNKETTTTFPIGSSSGKDVTVARQYTDGGRPKRIDVTQAGPSPANLPDTIYSYDKAGADSAQVQKITVTDASTAINQVVDYGYDQDFGTLTSAHADTGTDYDYTYDPAANLSTEKVDSTTTIYGYDRMGRPCWQGTADGTRLANACPATPVGDTVINRDNAGNSLGTSADPLTYNANNQVASIDGRTQGYLDLGNDLRVSTGTGTAAVGLVNSSLGVIARTTSAGTTWYIRDPKGKLLAEYGPGGTYYYVTNTQKSVTTLIDGTTGARAAYYRYTPHGDPTIVEDNTTGAGAANPWRYIGGYYDIEGDHYTKLGARYTDNHGHFNQPDPKNGTLDKPYSTLTYAYAGADPLNNEDPTGKSFFGCAAVSLGIGALAVNDAFGLYAFLLAPTGPGAAVVVAATAASLILGSGFEDVREAQCD